MRHFSNQEAYRNSHHEKARKLMEKYGISTVDPRLETRIVSQGSSHPGKYSPISTDDDSTDEDDDQESGEYREGEETQPFPNIKWTDEKEKNEKKTHSNTVKKRHATSDHESPPVKQRKRCMLTRSCLAESLAPPGDE